MLAGLSNFLFLKKLKNFDLTYFIYNLGKISSLTSYLTYYHP